MIERDELTALVGEGPAMWLLTCFGADPPADVVYKDGRYRKRKGLEGEAKWEMNIGKWWTGLVSAKEAGGKGTELV